MKPTIEEMALDTEQEALAATQDFPKDGETPRTDAAERVYKSWQEYAKQYGHIPEAMEQAPEYADPFEISRELERDLIAAQAALAEARSQSLLYADKLSAAYGDISQLRRQVDNLHHELRRGQP
jgi:hypothetical protein